MGIASRVFFGICQEPPFGSILVHGCFETKWNEKGSMDVTEHILTFTVCAVQNTAVD